MGDALDEPGGFRVALPPGLHDMGHISHGDEGFLDDLGAVVFQVEAPRGAGKGVGNVADQFIVPEREWVIVDPGVKEVNVMAHHGPPFPPDLNIVQIFSGAGIRPTGLVGEALDMESRSIMTEDEVEGLPEQRDVARLMLKLYGV